MAKISNKQPVLKPQDLYVLLALLLSRGGGSVGYPELAEQTGLAVSAVHGALKRAAAQLAMFQDRRSVVPKTQLCEFLLYGAKYAFSPVPVWPHHQGGGARGELGSFVSFGSGCSA